jgi:hypothetical protein
MAYNALTRNIFLVLLEENAVGDGDNNDDDHSYEDRDCDDDDNSGDDADAESERMKEAKNTVSIAMKGMLRYNVMQRFERVLPGVQA